MSFWRYFKGKLSGLGYILLGVFAMAAGAWLITNFGLGKNIFEPNLDTLCCASGGLLILVAGLVMAYGQRKITKLDE